MKKLIIYRGDSPVYVEGFDKDCERSRKGSLHIRPKRPITLTDGEYKYITDEKGKYAFMKPWIKVISEMKKGDARLLPEGEAVSKEAAQPKSVKLIDKPKTKTVKKQNNKKAKKVTRKKTSKKS